MRRRDETQMCFQIPETLFNVIISWRVFLLGSKPGQGSVLIIDNVRINVSFRMLVAFSARTKILFVEAYIYLTFFRNKLFGIVKGGSCLKGRLKIKFLKIIEYVRRRAVLLVHYRRGPCWSLLAGKCTQTTAPLSWQRSNPSNHTKGKRVIVA